MNIYLIYMYCNLYILWNFILNIVKYLETKKKTDSIHKMCLNSYRVLKHTYVYAYRYRNHALWID